MASNRLRVRPKPPAQEALLWTGENIREACHFLNRASIDVRWPEGMLVIPPDNKGEWPMLVRAGRYIIKNADLTYQPIDEEWLRQHFDIEEEVNVE